MPCVTNWMPREEDPMPGRARSIDASCLPAETCCKTLAVCTMSSLWNFFAFSPNAQTERAGVVRHTWSMQSYRSVPADLKGSTGGSVEGRVA